MTSGVAAFMVAVGGTSLVCYLLMSRVQNRKPQRESRGGDTYGMASSSGGDGWSPLSWFGSNSSLSYGSGSYTDSSSGDSGGGGGGGGD